MPIDRSQYRNLAPEQEYEDQGTDDWGFIQDVVAPPPAPVAAPDPAAPFNPATFDWTQGTQNIGGFTYQPIYNSTGQGETFEQGPLTQVLRYKEGETDVGESYDILDPTTWQQSGTGQFKEVGNLGDMLQTAANDFAPLATFALGVGPLGGMLGSAVAGGLGIPVATTAGAAGLTAAQVAALGSAAGGAGIGLAQGKDLGDVLEGAAKAVLPSLISTGINLPDYQVPGVKEIVGNAFPDSVSDAVVRGAQDLTSAAVKSAITGQDLNVANALLPSVVGEVADTTGLPKPVVQLGIQSLLGGELTPEGIFKTIVQNAPTVDTSRSKTDAQPTASDVSGGYGGAEATGFYDPETEDAQSLFPEFDNPLLTAPVDQLPPFITQAKSLTPGFDAAGYAERYPDLMAAFGNDEEKLAQHWLNNGQYEGRDASAYTKPTDQQVVTTGTAASVPIDIDYLTEILQSQSSSTNPITPIEAFKFQEANASPVDQQVVTTGSLQTTTPDILDVLGTLTGEPLPDEPPGVIEGPSTIEVTGTKATPDFTEVPEQTPGSATDTTPQPPTPDDDRTGAAPTPSPAPAPTPAPSPAPTPSPAPAPKAQSTTTRPGSSGAQLTRYDPVIAQVDPYDVGRLFSLMRQDDLTIEDLLKIISGDTTRRRS